MLHTTGGYMVGAAATFRTVFDHRDSDVFWCTADCGWITGHSYLTYGPLLCGATQVVFEGVPTWPDAGRCWQVVDKYKARAWPLAAAAACRRSRDRAALGGEERAARQQRSAPSSLLSPARPNAPAHSPPPR